jgi:kynurenine formamidase
MGKRWNCFGKFFANVHRSATQEDIHSAAQTAVNGLQPWTKKGLMGRGVLIDFVSYAEKNGIQVSHFEGFAITLDQVLAIAAEQQLELHTGGILFLRTGFTTAYKTLDKDQRRDIASRKEWCGLGQSRETTEWLWERQFAAVASDSPGFEVKRKSKKPHASQSGV